MDNKKKIQKLKKHISNLQRGLQALSHIGEKEQEAWWIQAHLHLYSIEKGGIEASSFDFPETLQFIPIRRNLGPKRELALRFHVIKKQKKDLERLSQRMHAANEAIKTLEERTVSEGEKSFVKKETPSPRKPYYAFLSSLSEEIWVGRTANDNETLTFQLARGGDLWLHISGKAGPHLIIPLRNKKAPGPETIQDAFQLALHFSGKLSTGEVTVTERRWVHKVRGKRGAVTLQTMKTFFVRKDEAQLERILKTKIKNHSSSLKR